MKIDSKIDVSGLNHHSGIDDAKMILKVFTYLLSYEEFKIEKEDVIIIPKDYDSHSDRTLGDYNRVFKLTNVAWIRGLPFTVRKSEVEEVLQGLEYTSFHLVAVKDNPKQCNGSMYVVFKDIEETRKSLVQVQGKYIGKRYLEVKYSSEEDMNQHLKEVGEMIQ